VGHEHDGRPRLLPALVDQLAHGILLREIERQQWFITQQHPRVTDERLRDAKTLLLAARQPSDRGVGVGAGADRVDRARDRGAGARPGHGNAAAMSVEAELDEVSTSNGKVGIEGALLRHVPDRTTSTARWPAVDLDAAVCRGDESEEDLDQRGFAGTVRAQHGEKFAACDVEVEVFEQHPVPEANGHVVEPHQRSRGVRHALSLPALAGSTPA